MRNQTKFIGRDFELALGRALLTDAMQGRAGSLLFSGEAGIGKTTLLGQITAEAKKLGFTVRRVLGTPSETRIANAALNSLLVPDLRGELDPTLAWAAGLSTTGPGSTSSDPLTRESAEYDEEYDVAALFAAHISSLAASAPLLIVVDDLQWIDLYSSKVLALCATQLIPARVCLVFGYRSTSSLTSEVEEAPEVAGYPVSDQLFADVQHQLLRPLTEAETLDLFTARGFPRERASALAFESRGIPAAIATLARQPERTGAKPKLADKNLGEAMFTGGEPPSADVRVASADRFGRLSRPALQLCRLALLDEHGPAVSDVLGSSFEAALSEAQGAGIVTFNEGQVRFSQPLLRSTVGATMSPAERRKLHLTLAEWYDREFERAAAATEAGLGSQLAADLESLQDRFARHRAGGAFGIDNAAASVTVAYAERAKARGALAEAARAWFRASELSGDHDTRVRLLLAGADALSVSGSPMDGLRAATRARRLTSDPDLIAEADAVISAAGEWERDPGETTKDLIRRADQIEASNPGGAARALAQASAMAAFAGDLRHGIALGRRALEVATACGDEVGSFMATAQIGWNLGLAGEIEEAEALLSVVRPALEAQASAAVVTVESLLVSQRLTAMRVITEDWDVVETLALDAQRAARCTGAKTLEGLFSYIYAEVLWRRGRLAEAQAAMADTAPERMPSIARAWGFATQARIYSAIGDSEALQKSATAALELCSAINTRVFACWAHAALGHFELSHGRYSDALPSFDRAVEFYSTMGFGNPSALFFHGDYLDALVGYGNRQESLAALDAFRLVAQRTGSRWALGIVARVAGQLDAVLDERTEGFDAAIGFFGSLKMSIEVARTLMYRAARVRDVDPLQSANDIREAIALFEAAGATVWAERARQELATDRTTQSSILDSLTKAEKRVALSTAAGRSSRETAAELHISARTVEFHLQSIYRKLAVRARTEFVALLASDGRTPPR